MTIRSGSLLSCSLALALMVGSTVPAHARGGGGGHTSTANVHAPPVQKTGNPTARTAKKKADGSLDAGIHFKYDLKANKGF